MVGVGDRAWRVQEPGYPPREAAPPIWCQARAGLDREGRNVRGYNADAFRTEAVAVYLRAHPRDASNPRNGSSARALSSDPSEASGLSAVAPESIPPIGDEGYLEHLYAALEAGLITEGEWHEGDRAHRLVWRVRR